MNDFDYARDNYLSKPLPSSPDSERCIVGGVILENGLITQAIEKNLKPEDFYSPNNRRIFKAMLYLFEKGENLDPVLIGEELKKDVSIDSIGGVATITNLTYGLPHFRDIYDYIKVVKGKSIARNLIKICSQVTSETLAEETDIYEAVGEAGQSIFQLLDSQEKKGFQSVGEVVKISFDKTKARAVAMKDSAYTLRGLSTGFRDLNEKTSGIVSPELIVVAGRPGMGKTSLVLNIAENATEDDKEAVIGVFSLEMASDLLGSRLLCSRAKVDSHRYANGYLTKDEWGRIAIAAEELNAKKIFFEDSPNQTVIELQAQAQKLKAEKKRLDLIIIDHLGLVKSQNRKDTKHQQISDIMKEFVGMKKILGCPIILLSQLSRAVEKRNPPIPMMSDLRESGSIEEDADGVWLIYRAEYYKATEENAGKAELIVGKNRNGPTGTVKLVFMKEFTRFENYWGD